MSPTSHIEISTGLVRQMAHFLKTGNLSAPISQAVATTDHRVLRLICIELLAWLRFGLGKPKLRPLNLSEFGSSAAQFSAFLDSDGIFAEVFSKEVGGHISLKIDEEREELCKLAAEVHKPQRFTTPRH